MSGLIVALLIQTSAWSLPATRPCSAVQIAELTAPAVPDAAPYRLTCRAELNGAQVTRRILIEGSAASGSSIDCGGGALGRLGARTTTQAPTVAIWSRQDKPGPHASRPTDIAITNCTIHGAIRIWGMGAGGSMSDLLESSRTPDHTATVQAVAPSHIRLSNLTFQGTGSIPLYVGPGVTDVSVTGSRFGGVSDSTAIYLDAESARVILRDNSFATDTSREQIAIDGSAFNQIVGNRFDLGSKGGVFLYRNCGEDGVIRHQTPSGNRITDNVFSGAARFRPRTVVIGAREGNRRYCSDDRGYSFGSSADDGDHATGNIVNRNRVLR